MPLPLRSGPRFCLKPFEQYQVHIVPMKFSLASKIITIGDTSQAKISISPGRDRTKNFFRNQTKEKVDIFPREH